MPAAISSPPTTRPTSSCATRPPIDHATPAGNAAVIEALARLFYLTGRSAYRDRAEATYGAFAGEIGRNFFPLASFLNAGAFLEEALQVVIVGEAADSRAMLEAVRRHPAGRIVLDARRAGGEPARGPSRRGQGPSRRAAPPPMSAAA